MQNITKKRLPENIAYRLRRHAEENEFKTYYIIDDEIYVHTKFYVEGDEEVSLTLMHDIAFIESEMIKHMSMLQKMYIDEDNIPFFALYDLALWFYDCIPSKDWYDLLSFLRILSEHEKLTNYIDIDRAEETVH